MDNDETLFNVPDKEFPSTQNQTQEEVEHQSSHKIASTIKMRIIDSSLNYYTHELRINTARTWNF